MRVCDAQQDCADNSDESPSICGNSKIIILVYLDCDYLQTSTHPIIKYVLLFSLFVTSGTFSKINCKGQNCFQQINIDDPECDDEEDDNCKYTAKCEIHKNSTPESR